MKIPRTPRSYLMELTRVERTILANQLLILEKLNPEWSSQYEPIREALERGWTLHYEDAVRHVDRDELSPAACQQVVDILDMYRAITFALAKIDPDDELQKHYYARFDGFDGNNETRQVAYARYYVHKLDRFKELLERTDDDFNSHSPALATYRQMLSVWQALPSERRYRLARVDLELVLKASGF
jgi:uncharacterized protein YfbU (UPF0304 family)